MTTRNPAPQARVGADALARLVHEVRTARAQWSHPHLIRQGTDDLTRATDAIATAVQQMAAALAGLQPGPSTQTAITALHQAGQAVTTASGHLRQARRTMH